VLVATISYRCLSCCVRQACGRARARARIIKDELRTLANSLLFLRCMKNQESNVQKNPDDWKTGDEPMTAAQRSYLETLSQDVGEDFDEPELTKAEASKRIEELKSQSPRLEGDEG
jgi:hypothetical protein